jgi:hypothetical protein
MPIAMHTIGKRKKLLVGKHFLTMRIIIYDVDGKGKAIIYEAIRLKV